jgi:hypothetical protein
MFTYYDQSQLNLIEVIPGQPSASRILRTVGITSTMLITHRPKVIPISTLLTTTWFNLFK